jgi:hypothetical protein
MIRELDIVRLACDWPSLGLKRGATGTVVLVHEHGAAYEVEISTPTGETMAVITLTADLIVPGPARAAHSSLPAKT